MNTRRFAAFAGVLLLAVGGMGCASRMYDHGGPAEPGARVSATDQTSTPPVAAPATDKVADATGDWRTTEVEVGTRELQGPPPVWEGNGLKMRLSTNGTAFRLDAKVPFLVEIMNAGPRAEIVGLNYKGRIFTLLVMRDLPNQQVDTVRLVMGEVPPQKPQGSIDLAGTLVLKPGEFKRWVIGWPCERVQGERVSPGSYRARAVLGSYDHHVESNEVQFKLNAK